MSELTIEGASVQIEPKPVAWELSAPELIYPFAVEVKQRVMKYFLHMKQYRADDLKKMLAETAYMVKFEDDDVSEIVKGKPEKLAAFFWKYFSRVSGHGRPAEAGDPSLEEQKAWITNTPRLEITTRTVLEGFGGISVKETPQTEDDENPEVKESEIFQIDLQVNRNISLFQKLFIPGIGIVRLDMVHNFRRETATECQRYERATDKQLIHKKKRGYERSTNYDLIEQLYDALIESVDGMTLNGKPCDADNKEKWVKEIPFWHKYLALTEFFARVQSKNA